MGVTWKQIGGIGKPTGGIGGGGVSPTTSTPPGSATITAVDVIDGTPDATGNPQKQVTVSFVAPSPPGTFKGNWVYLDAPDSSGQLSIADGTVPADGSTAAAPTFQPVNEGFFPYTSLQAQQLTFLAAAPTTAQLWRVYLCGGAPSAQVLPIEAGQPLATPSWQFYVAPPASGSTGREFAPLVQNIRMAPSADWPSGWTANPNITVADSGDQYFQFDVEFDWPTNDQNFQSLGGVNIILMEGVIQVYPGNIAVSPSSVSLVLPKLPVLQGTVTYTAYFISYDVNGNNNSLVSGVTPSVEFSITRSSGGAGIEYTHLVVTDGVHPFVTVTPVVGADGTQLLQIDGYWKNLSPGDAGYDATFGGVECVLDKNDGHGAIWSVRKASISPLENDISQPATVQSWIFYLRSIDINGRANSIVPGTTPSVTISVGNALGQLNLAKAAAGTYSNEFVITGGVMKINALSANTIVTGNLQVGGTLAGQVGEVKIFDRFGSSLIGWIGDDSATSGFTGAWFKQIRIGGASPAASPISADSSGNVSISGSVIIGSVTSATNATTAGSVPAGGVAGSLTNATLTVNLNGVTTTVANLSVGGGAFAGLQVQDNSTFNYVRVLNTGIAVAFGGTQIVTIPSNLSSGQINILSSGSSRVTISGDPTNFAALTVLDPNRSLYFSSPSGGCFVGFAGGGDIQFENGANHALRCASNLQKMVVGVFQFSGSSQFINTGLSVLSSVVATLATGGSTTDTVATSGYSGGGVTFYTTSVSNPFCAWMAFGTR